MLWSMLPYMLALMLSLPAWASAAPQLATDTVAGNLHTLAYALHALLASAEPCLARSAKASGQAIGSRARAHKIFIEVCGLVIQHWRSGADAPPQKPDTRPVAAILVALEHLVSISSDLNDGDLEEFVPHALANTQYAHTWDETAGRVTGAATPRADAQQYTPA